jgi:formylglycine-generating enzyme required for sulfatase activity
LSLDPNSEVASNARQEISEIKDPKEKSVTMKIPPESSAGLLATTPGRVFKDCADSCPEMVVVPAGSFMMGSPSSEKDRVPIEGPQHQVRIAQPFAMGKYEVTVGEYRAFVRATGYNPSDVCGVDRNGTGHWHDISGYAWGQPGYKGYQQSDRDPVVCVSWYDAQVYVSWLSSKTGKQYQLPSEAAWEYAARAGTTTPYSWGTSADNGCTSANGPDIQVRQQSWWQSARSTMNCDDKHVFTAPVGSYKPNAFGLFDMSGNAWELVEDCFIQNYNSAPSDGSAIESRCDRRALRGGSWADFSAALRPAFRASVVTDERFSLNGFRVARAL